jgi:hypothetical protein
MPQYELGTLSLTRPLQRGVRLPAGASREAVAPAELCQTQTVRFQYRSRKHTARIPRLPAQTVRAEKEGRARSTHLQPWHMRARLRSIETASEAAMLRRFLHLTGTLARTPLSKDSEGVDTDTQQVDSPRKRSSTQRPQQVDRRTDDALPEDSNLARQATQRRMRLRSQGGQSSHVAAKSSRQPNG